MPICRLCLNPVDSLIDSHLIPRAAYKMLRAELEGQKERPAVMLDKSKMKTYRSTQQVSTHMLCETCEKLFSEHGERRLGTLWATRKEFRLLTQLRAAVPYEPNHYGGNVLSEADRNCLVYFAISVIWRASRWPKKLGEYNGCLGATYEEKFRQYLVSPTKLDNVRVMLYVNYNPFNAINSSITFPALHKTSMGKIHLFGVPGLHFRVFVGQTSAEIEYAFKKIESPLLLIAEDFATGYELTAMQALFMEAANRKAEIVKK